MLCRYCQFSSARSLLQLSTKLYYQGSYYWAHPTHTLFSGAFLIVSSTIFCLGYWNIECYSLSACTSSVMHFILLVNLHLRETFQLVFWQINFPIAHQNVHITNCIKSHLKQWVSISSIWCTIFPLWCLTLKIKLCFENREILRQSL